MRTIRTAKGRSKLYLFWAAGTSWFKIGFTKGPTEKRAAGVQVGCAVPLVVVCERDGGAEAEKELHQALRQFRMEGEWFNLPEDAVWWLLIQFGAVNEKHEDIRTAVCFQS